MTSEVTQNERTAVAQTVTNQPDGPGKRIGKRGELVLFGKVCPGGAELFRQRLPQFQAEAAYWESRVGTVHDFRAFLFDNDTRIMFLITYDGDFKAYVKSKDNGAVIAATGRTIPQELDNLDQQIFGIKIKTLLVDGSKITATVDETAQVNGQEIAIKGEMTGHRKK